MPEIWNDTKKWELVQAAVQGQPAPASCLVKDGRIVCSLEPIPAGTEQNLKLLSDILRSEEPLPAVAREWLADLFDPSAASPYRVKELTRRVRGAKPLARWRNIDAARYALELMGWGESNSEGEFGKSHEKWAVAVKLTADEFGISETAVQDAIKSYRDALAGTHS